MLAHLNRISRFRGIYGEDMLDKIVEIEEARAIYNSVDGE